MSEQFTHLLYDVWNNVQNDDVFLKIFDSKCVVSVLVGK